MPQKTVVFLYQLWLLAFLLKSVGSAWDISWHFRSLRDSAFIPPHDVNLLGDGLAIAGIVFHTFTGYGMDKASLRLTQWGMGIFLIAAPLDEINHRINGLDITTWSPSHFLLFLGTAIVIAGMVRGLLHNVGPGRFRTLALIAGFAFFLENAMFPNGQQEYGIVEIMSWDAGHWQADPDVAVFLANEIGHAPDRAAVLHFALPIPDWFYPLFGILAATLVLVMARRIVGRHFTATTIAAIYVGYRTLGWVLLNAVGYPRSALPFWLVVLGLSVDLAFALQLRWPARVLLGSALATALGHLALLAQAGAVLAPPVQHAVAPVTFLLLAGLWALAESWWPRRYQRLLGALSRGPLSAGAAAG